MKRIQILMPFILMVITFMSCKEDAVINIKPVAAFKVATSTLEVGQSITFNDLSFDEDGEITKWEWNFGNGSNSVEQSPAISYNQAGEYNVVLTVWDNMNAQNVNNFSKLITVKEKSLSDETPEILWEYLAPAGFQDASPAVDKLGNIILGCDAKDTRGVYNIVVLDKTGKEKWKYASGDVVRSTPTVSDNGIFYIGSYDKKLYAFNPESSEPLSTFDTGATVKYSAPVVDSDGIVYYAGNKKLYAISADPTMTKIWEADCGGDTQSTPIIGENAIYVCANSGKIFAFNKSDGSKIWETSFGKSSSAAPALGNDGTIYLCGNTNDGGIVMAVNSLDGSIKWQVPGVAEYANSGIALDLNGHVYVGDNDGIFTCYDQETGDIVWSFRTQGNIRCTPAIMDNGNICFGDGAGYFYVLNQEGKSVYKEIKLGEQIYSSPVIGSDGIVYLCANVKTNQEPGKVYALKTNANGAQNTWSMRSGNFLRNGRLE